MSQQSAPASLPLPMPSLAQPRLQHPSSTPTRATPPPDDFNSATASQAEYNNMMNYVVEYTTERLDFFAYQAQCAKLGTVKIDMRNSTAHRFQRTTEEEHAKEIAKEIIDNPTQRTIEANYLKVIIPGVRTTADLEKLCQQDEENGTFPIYNGPNECVSGMHRIAAMLNHVPNLLKPGQQIDYIWIAVVISCDTDTDTLKYIIDVSNIFPTVFSAIEFGAQFVALVGSLKNLETNHKTIHRWRKEEIRKSINHLIKTCPQVSKPADKILFMTLLRKESLTEVLFELCQFPAWRDSFKASHAVQYMRGGRDAVSPVLNLPDSMLTSYTT